jgi:BirA family biotin operon repressor/biotin-[acetyl-CoA-carboxylase] ligase
VEPIRWRVEEFDSIDSTNSWLKARAVEGAPEGLVARADFQSAGRGRLDRRWEAPVASSLLTSILLRAPVAEDERYLLSVAVALSARAALVRLSGVRPQLKWPNDLVVGDAKLAGILAEAVVDANRALAVVVGIGVNLTWPGPSGAGSTCVQDLAGVTLAPRAVLDILLEELENRLAELYDGNSVALREELHGALRTLGQQVRVEGPSGTVEGLARSIDERGRLEIVSSQETRFVEVGDITHLRTSPRDES